MKARSLVQPAGIDAFHRKAEPPIVPDVPGEFE